MSVARRLARALGRTSSSRRLDLRGAKMAPGFDLAWFKESSRLWPVLDRPPRVAAGTCGLPSDELVLEVVRGKEAVAYPARSLSLHHVVNDEIDGGAIAVTFCLKCLSGAAFSPVVDGRALKFQVAGLYKGVMAMRDRETATVWSQMTGEALVGPLVGCRLPLEPVTMGTLKGFLLAHPDAMVPDPVVLGEYRFPRPGLERAATMRSDDPRWDRRLPGRTLVLGVVVDQVACAFVLDVENPGPHLLQSIVGAVPIVLLAPPGAWPIAFDRRILGSVLEFRFDGERFVSDDGTVWSPEAEAVAGPAEGRRLGYVPSHLTEWHGWAAYYPHTEIRQTSMPG